MYENPNVETVTKRHDFLNMGRKDSYLSISVKCLKSDHEI